jgi:radical SAM protein with 4Fe4S-binding SPASM domain
MRKFRKTYIEITNICNLSCPFCPQNKRDPRMMSAGEFGHALQQLAPYTSLLHFHVLGEPLLHPQTGSFLEMCHKTRTQVHIVTNGTHLHQCTTELQNRDALRSVSISLQSICATATKVEFCNYLDLLLEAIGTFDNSGPPLFSLRLWNRGSVSGKISFEEAIMEIEHRFNTQNLLESLRSQRGCMLRSNVCINTAGHFEWPHIGKEPEGDSGYCLGLKEQIAVLADGTVVPCCLDCEGVINLGNIFTTPIETILASDRTQVMKKSFQKNIVAEELCRHCRYRTRFSSEV